MATELVDRFIFMDQSFIKNVLETVEMRSSLEVIILVSDHHPRTKPAVKIVARDYRRAVRRINMHSRTSPCQQVAPLVLQLALRCFPPFSDNSTRFIQVVHDQQTVLHAGSETR
jgi:hypothetical protein